MLACKQFHNNHCINLIIAEFKNSFVSVSFHPNYTSVYCKFLDIPSLTTNYRLNCSIAYGALDYEHSYEQHNSTNVSDTVVVEINATKLNQLPSHFRHFIITAANDTSTVYIEGKFNLTDQGKMIIVFDECHI